MNINEFVNERKGEWDKLERIAAKFRAGSAPRLSREELWELGRLYTGAISDLSVLKSSSIASDPANDIVKYLNGLVVRVHGSIYRKPPFRWGGVLGFLKAGFPRTIRRTALYVFVSATLFLFFGLVGFVLAAGEPGFVELVVPDTIIETVEKGDVWFNDLHTIAPQASSALMTNNISVSFLAVAAGITFGVGTCYILALNGLLLGTVAALCYSHGLSLEFWSFVLPHGSLELTAIVIAGAAGLVLGHALVDPGPFKRAEFLSVRGKEVGQLALGCVPLLVCAGFIEAFLSPSPLPAWSKFLFAGLAFSTLMTYFLVAGRSESDADATPRLPSHG